MLRIYVVEDLKRILAGVHENVSNIMTLADYCDAIIVGCNRFKKMNELPVEDLAEEKVFFEQIKDEALSIYDLMEEEVSKVEAVDGKIGKIKSVPMSMNSRMVENNLAYADSGDALLRAAEEARSTVNKMVDCIITNAENVIDAKRFNPAYVEEVTACVEKIIDYTQESLKNIRNSTKSVVATEENPEEYCFD